MSTEIGVDVLRQWLDERRPVSVIDIRPSDDRAQWWIPGSIHVDAYDALRRGEPGPLATLALPVGRHHSLKLYGSSGVSGRTSGRFDLVGVAWQVRFGRGF